jgi:gamma-glutamyltranspeptidase/glutathione hydrolase
VATLKPELEALGHTVSVIDQTSGLHGITVQDHPRDPGKRLAGGADPRREGVAKGDSGGFERGRKLRFETEKVN